MTRGLPGAQPRIICNCQRNSSSIKVPNLFFVERSPMIKQARLLATGPVHDIMVKGRHNFVVA